MWVKLITSIVCVHVISFTHMTSCVTIWELKKTGIPISEVLMLAWYGMYPSINFTLYPFTVSDSKVGTVKSSFQGFSFFLWMLVLFTCIAMSHCLNPKETTAAGKGLYQSAHSGRKQLLELTCFTQTKNVKVQFISWIAFLKMKGWS